MRPGILAAALAIAAAPVGAVAVDLAPIDLSVTPVAVESGGAVDVADTVIANGGAAGGFNVAFYASPDAVITPTMYCDDGEEVWVCGGDTYLGSRWVPGLAAGASSSGTTRVTLPVSMTGTIYVGVVVDDQGAIAESDETNNTLAGNPITVSKPDLTVASLATPATLEAGGTLTVTDSVAATGGATGGFWVRFYLSADPTVTTADTYIGGRWMSGLASGATSTATTAIPLSPTVTGTYYVGAIVDADGSVAESDETNNGLAGNVITISKPDLVVASVAVTPETLGAGGTLTVTDSVTATGGATTGFWVRFYLSADAAITTADTNIGGRWVSGLVSGGTSSAATAIALPPNVSGTFSVGAIVDPDGGVPESDETNNGLAGNTVAIAKPDLAVASLTATPATLASGGTLTIADSVTATGGPGGRTAGFWVRFYLSADAVITTADTFIGGRWVASLAPGATSSATTTIALPFSTAGTFYVGAIADADGGVVESDETNNALAANTVAITPAVDLVPTALSVPPAAERGGSIDIADTVVASGGAAGGFNVSFYASPDAVVTPAVYCDDGEETWQCGGDTYLGSRWVPGLAAGASSSGTTRVTLPLSLTGPVYVGVAVDAEGAIAESDEMNNALANTITISKPDLRVASLEATPSTLAAGGTLTVTDSVAATGGATGGFWVRFYLSADPTVTTADTYIGGRWVSGLASGATSTATTAIPLSPTVTGTYYVGAIADADGGVAESDETNNALAGNVITIAKPDLVVASLAATPASLGAGGTLTVTDSVTATGGATAGFWVRLYLSADTTVTTADTYIGGRYVGGLASGGTSTATTALALPPNVSGTFSVGAIVDPDGGVAESDETNNALAGNTVTIATPDLAVASLTANPATLATGGTLTIVDSVTATGGPGGKTAGFWVRFYLSADAITTAGRYIGGRWVASLASGGTSSGSTVIPLPPSVAGTFYVGAIADADGGVVESDETNNARAGNAVAIVATVDLVPTVLSAPASAERGGSIDIADTVVASGGASGGFNVSFYASPDAVITPTVYCDDGEEVWACGGDTYLGSRWVPGLAAGASSSGTTSVTLPLSMTGPIYVGAVVDVEGEIAESDETNNTLVGDTTTISKPHRTVASVSATPSTLPAGGTLTITDSVKVTGGVSDGFWVRFYLSADATITAADAFIGARWVNQLASGAISSGSTTVALPVGLGGTQYVGAIADGAGDSDPTNNALAGNVITISKPDLVVASLAATPASLGAGGTLTVTDSVTATGGATTGFWVRFYLSADAAITTADTYIGGRWVTGLASGGTSSATTALALPPNVSGTYSVGAIVDPDGGVAESDETNNPLAGNTVTITKPDLVVASVTATPAALAAGGTLTIADSVTATGGPGGKTAGFWVRFYLSADPIITPTVYCDDDEGSWACGGDTYLGGRWIPSLASGATSSGSTAVAVPPSLMGSFYVGAMADADGGVVEADESNNALGTLIQVGVDQSAPVILVSGVADGAVTHEVPVTFCFDASDPNLASLEGTLNGVAVAGCGSAYLEGEYELFVRASDAAGTLSTKTVRFTIDLTSPQVAISGVVDGSVSNAASVTPTFTATDAHLVSTAATLDGSPVPFISGTAVQSEQDHLLVVTAMDAAGNGTTAQVSFALDRAAPSIVFAGIENGAVFGGSVTPDVVVSDAHPGTHSVTIDGAPYQTGAAVTAPGDHLLAATAMDAAGNTTTAQVSFAIDLTKPAVAVVSPADGSTTSAASVDVVATASDDRAIALVTINGATVMPGPDGRYVASVALTEGLNPIEVRARDRAGNVETVQLMVRRDSTAPELLVIAPAEGAVVTDPSVAVRGTVKDSSAVTLTVNGSATAVGFDGSFSATVSLAPGENTIDIVATDAAGNTSSVTRKVSGGAPYLSLAEPADGFVTAASTVTVRGAARPVAPATSVTVTVNGNDVTVAADGSFAKAMAVAGAVTFTVIAKDDRGLSTTRSVSGVAGMAQPGDTPPPSDSTPLALTVDSPIDGAISRGNVAVTGRVQGGKAPVRVTVAGAPATVSSGYFSAAQALTEGDQSIVIQATDAAGQVATAQRSVTVDATDPYLQVTRPASSPADVSESPYRIEGTVGDVNLSSVTVNGAAASVVAGSFAASVPLTAGNNDVLVEAKDVVGNVSRKTVRLTVQALPPQVAILSPLDGSDAAEAVLHVRASVDATAALQSVSVGAVAATQSGVEWVADVALALGDNTVTVSALDVNGMTGTATARVKYRDVTQEPLAVTGVVPAAGAKDVESDALVSVSFNKAVDASSLAGKLTLLADGAPLAGGFYVAPGGQTVSFIARQALPPGKRLVVRIAELAAEQGPGMDAAFASDFTTRAKLRRLSGVVVDERYQALENVKVTLEGSGQETRTLDDGNWTFFDVPAGTAIVRFEGGRTAQGEKMNFARRRIFVDGDKDTQDDPLVLFPEDVASAQQFDGGQDVHLGFRGRYPGLALDVEAGGVFLPSGRTAGVLTATQLPGVANPVPIESWGPAAGLWQVGPEGLRLTKPVTISLPNVSKEAAGRLVVIITYDPVRHMLVRTGIGRASADASVIEGLSPVKAAGLDLFGYVRLSDEQHAALDEALKSGTAPDQAPPSGTTGSLLLRGDRSLLRYLVELVVSPAYAQALNQFDLCKDPADTVNCYSPFGLIDGKQGPSGSMYVHGRVRTSYLAETDTDPLSYFEGWLIEARAMNQAKGVTGDYGQFSIPVRGSAWGDAFAYTYVDTGTRFRVWKEQTEDGGQRVRYLPLSSKYLIAATAFNMITIPAYHRSDLIVDLRVLKGKLRFVNRKGEPIGGACDAGATTERAPNGDLLSVSPQDVAFTEVHFFRGDDESAPIARYTVAVPGTEVDQCQGPGVHASYVKLRLGPSDASQKRVLEQCWYYESRGLDTLSGDERIYYQMNCARPRETRVRLHAGDKLKIVAVNHATGHTGMAKITVPSITTNNDCPDEEKIAFTDRWAGGRTFTICPQAAQSIVIPADIDLYPPEIDVRVARRATDEGIRNDGSRKEHLVRHGGAATTRDDVMQVATHWRVRLEPELATTATPLPLPVPEGDTEPGPKFDPYGGVTGAPGQPGSELEVLCSDLPRGASPERKEACKLTEKRLDELPKGIPPLAAQVVRVTNSAVEQPAVSIFRVAPGRATGTVQTAIRMQLPGGGSTRLAALNRANYYVHVVGHPLLFNDANENGTIEREELEALSPAPPNLTNFKPGDPPGLPAAALGLKDVYLGAEPDGTLIPRFDRAREHEFRVVEVERKEILAEQAKADPRKLDQPPSGEEPSAQRSDIAYQFLLNLLEPDTAGRAGTLSGDYQVRLGSDSYGLECKVTIDSTAGALTGDCGGEHLYDVLAAQDILYFELFLSGNAENVLYRFNFHGLSRRKDYLAVGSEYTAEKARTADVDGAPDVRRPVSVPSKAITFVSPSEFTSGTLQICTEAQCGSSASVLKAVALSLQPDGTYSVSETGGTVKAQLVQAPDKGVGGACRFELPLPPQLAAVPGIEQLASSVFAVFTSQDRKSTVALGRPKSEFQGAHVRAPGQPDAAGVNLADGHVSLEEEDLSLPELGHRVSFTRHYDNQWNEQTPLGAGWAHGFDGFVVQETVGRYVVVLAGQAYAFPKCVVDPAQNASSCTTDKSHGATLTVTKTNGSWDVAFTTVDGVRYKFDELSEQSYRVNPITQQKVEDENRRRWRLTAFEDGHGEPSPSTNGWTKLTYRTAAAGQTFDLLDNVQRTPGTVKVTFGYRPVNDQDPAVSKELKRLAKRGFQLLDQVSLQVGTGVGAATHVITFKQDAMGNLVEVTRPGAPVSIWRYGYYTLEELPATPESPTSDAARASLLRNELRTAELFVVDQGADRRQWAAEYRRSCSSRSYAHVHRCEVVDSVVLPGKGGAPIQISYESSRRTVTEPSAVSDTSATPLVTVYDLNRYGNAKVVTVGSATTRLAWGSDADDGKVAVTSHTSPTLRTIAYEYDDRLRETSATLVSAGQDTMAAAGIAPGTVLRDVAPAGTGAAFHERFGVPLAVLHPAADGSITTETTELWPTGDVKLTRTTDAAGRTLALHQYTSYEGDVLRTEIDEAGRTIQYANVDPGGEPLNPFGLPESVTVSAPADPPVAAGALAVSHRRMKYDDRGRLRLAGVPEAASEETWGRDALGRLTSHQRGGTPPMARRWEYVTGADRLEVREFAGADSTPRRTKVFANGLPESESIAYGAPEQIATKAYTHLNGKLVRLVDVRGVTHRYFYDAAGHLTRATAQGAATPQETEELFLSPDGEGKPLTAKDHNGLETRIRYDVLGRAAFWDRSVAGDRDEEEVLLDLHGAAARRVVRGLAGEHAYAYVLDGLGRVEKTTSGDSSVNEERTYAGGRLATVIDRVTELEQGFEYGDALGRLTKHWRKVQGAETTGAAELYHTETRSYVSEAGGVRVTAQHGADWKDVVGGGSGTNTWKLEWVEDGLGRTLERTSWVHGAPATRRYEFDARSGELSKEWEPSATGATVYDRDRAGYVTALTDPVGNMISYGVDPAGLTTSQVGPLAGETWTTTYDAFGQVATRAVGEWGTTPAGTWTYTYDRGARTVTEVDPLGFTMVRTFNGRGLVAQEVKRDTGGTRPSSNVFTTTFAYDGTWLKRRESTEGSWRSILDRSSFDDRGRPLSEVESWSGAGRAYDYATTYSWTKRNAEVTDEDVPTGGLTSRKFTLVHDSLGNVVRRTPGSDATKTERWAYDAAGYLMAERPAGELAAASLVYEDGLLRSRTLGGDETTTYSYRFDGRLRSVKNEVSGRSKTYSWDARGLLSREEYGLPPTDVARTDYGYDAAGRLSTIVKGVETSDAATWSYGYGPRGEQTSVTLPSGHVFAYGHDAGARLASITPPGVADGTGAVPQTFEQDYLGRTIKRTRGTSTWTTTWSDGQGITTDPLKNETLAVVDGRGRVAGRSVQLLVSEQARAATDVSSMAIFYDRRDQPTSARETTPGGMQYETTYRYDDRYTLTRVTQQRPTQTDATYTYTPGGQIETVVSPSGTATYAYDSLNKGRLKSITNGKTSTSFEWEPGGGAVALVTTGSNHFERRCYDGPGRLMGVIVDGSKRECGSYTDVRLEYWYGYDKRGNRTTENYLNSDTAMSVGVETTTFYYDVADRLKAESSLGAGGAEYLLGSDGTRLGQMVLSGPASSSDVLNFTYDTAGGLKGAHRSSNASIPVAAYQTDAAGQLVSESTDAFDRRYTWDVWGRLRTVTATDRLAWAGLPTTPSANIQYGYRFDGLRTGRDAIAPVGDGTQTHAETSTYVWGGKNDLLTEHTEDAFLERLSAYFSCDAWLAAVEARAVGHDGVESAAGIGSTALYRHDAFGNYIDKALKRTWDMDPALRMPDPAKMPPSNAGSLGFGGHAVDPASGLVYAKARWYHPGVGRFLSEDPKQGRLEDPMSLHAFAYANGNPVSNVDTTGAASVPTTLCSNAVTSDRNAVARGIDHSVFAMWRGLDIASFGTLEGVAHIVDAADMGDPRYQGEEGLAQGYRDMWAVAGPGLAKTAVAAFGGRLLLAGRAAGASAALGERIVATAGKGALLGGAVNTAGQLAELGVGTRDSFSFGEVASEAVAWGAFGAGAEASLAAVSATARGASGAWAQAWSALRPRLNPMNRTVEVYAFRATSNRAARARLPQASTGHVGISFDEGTTIYGFGPYTDRMPVAEVLERLKAGESFRGLVGDHTEVFRRAARFDIPIQVFPYPVTRLRYWTARGLVAIDRGLGRFVPKRYSFPPRQGGFAPGCYNCATYPTSVGLETPVPTGRLKEFLE